MSDFAVSTALTAKDAGFSALMDKAAHGAEKFEKAVKEAFGKSEHAAEHHESVFKAAFMAISFERLAEKGIEAIGELPKMLGEFAEKGDAIARQSAKLGMTAEAYQKMAFAMKMVDIPAETMDGAFKKLNLGLGQLKVNQGAMVEGLKRTNPELLKQLRGAKSSTEAFTLTAEAIANTSDAQKRAAIAVAVFGKSGQELLPILALGKEGLAKLNEEAVASGTILGDKAVEGASRMDETLKRLRATQDAVGNSIMGSIVEKLNPLLEKFYAWADANKDIIAQNLTGILEGIGSAVQLVTDLWNSGFIPALLVGIATFMAIKQAALAFAAVSGAIGIITAAWEAYTLFAGGAATAQEALNLVMTANPIGLVVAAVAALVGVGYLLVANWETVGPVMMKTGQTIMKWILTPMNLAADAVLFLIDALAAIPGMDGLKSVADTIRKTKDGINQTLTGSAGTFDYAGTWAGGAKPAVQAPNASAVGLQASTQNNIKVEVNGVPGATVKTTSNSNTQAKGGRAAPMLSTNPRDGRNY